MSMFASGVTTSLVLAAVVVIVIIAIVRMLLPPPRRLTKITVRINPIIRHQLPFQAQKQLVLLALIYLSPIRL